MKLWFSVIVPVYNVESYIDRCVESLLNQSFDENEIEIILVDDGSTDSSGEKCNYYTKRYENIKVVHKKNGGLASARNEGMKYAQGEYIAFVDSDDWVERNTYKTLYDHICINKSDIINFGYKKIKNGEILIEEHSEFFVGNYEKKQIESLILPNSIARKKAYDQVNLPVQLSACMCVYKREFLESYNIDFESERVVLSEDWLFNIKCLCRAKSMTVIQDTLYNYDTRENSLSMSYKPDSYERRKRLFNRYKEELKSTGNWNNITMQRLKNFWLEAIYGCYIIELNAPVYNKERINIICEDEEFQDYLKKLSFKDCSLKGLAFKIIVVLKMHWIMRIAYCFKKMRMKN